MSHRVVKVVVKVMSGSIFGEPSHKDIKRRNNLNSQ